MENNEIPRRGKIDAFDELLMNIVLIGLMVVFGLTFIGLCMMCYCNKCKIWIFKKFTKQERVSDIVICSECHSRYTDELSERRPSQASCEGKDAKSRRDYLL